MTSEIRTNSLTSRAGLSTVTLTDSGPMFSGITTFVDNSGFNLGTGSSIFTPASNTLTFGTNSNERLRITSGGDLLIGTSTAAIGGGRGLMIASSTGARIKLCDSDAGVTANDGFEIIAGNGGTGYINNKENQAIVISTNNTERMRVTHEGSVGIGTNNSTYELEVHDGTGAAALRMKDGANNVICDLIANSNGGLLRTTYNHPLIFHTNQVERLRIQSGGNVMIGGNYTSTNLGKLHVDGVIGIDDEGSGTSTLNIMTAANTRLKIQATNSVSQILTQNGNYFTIKTDAGTGGGTERLRIDSSGRVLIGTTTEGAVSGDNLTIASNTYCGMTIRSGSSSEGNIFFSDATSGNGESVGMLRYEHANDAMVIKTANAERLRITSGGKIYFGSIGSWGSVSGIDNTNFAFTFSESTSPTHPNTNNRDFDFVTALQVHTPVRDTTNTPAIVISESGGQMSGRNSLVFFNGDYNSGTGYIKSRIYTQVGASYNSTQFYIDVADSSKNHQQRFRIDTSGNFHGSSSNNISDQRLKKDIATITDPLTKIKGLTGRTFKWKEDSTKFDDKTKFGFVAQEVETIVPELVSSDGLMHFDADDKICDEFEAVSHSKSVVETGVIPITVEAIKELITKVETLEQENIALRARVTNLEGN